MPGHSQRWGCSGKGSTVGDAAGDPLFHQGLARQGYWQPWPLFPTGQDQPQLWLPALSQLEQACSCAWFGPAPPKADMGGGCRGFQLY